MSSKPFYTDEEVLQQAMLSDGSFHIVSSDLASTWLTENRDTIVIHNCPNYTPKKSRRKYDNIRLTYWVMQESMGIPCPNCKRVPSEKIITVWTLQNMDRFPDDPKGWRPEEFGN